MPSPTGYTPSVVIPLSQNYLIDALLYGTAWQSTAGQTTLSYSFITPGQSQFAPSYGNHQESLSTFALTSAQTTAVANVLASWSSVANLQFTAVSETASDVGDLRFGGYSGMDEGTLAWAYLPSNTPAGGDVWIGPATSSAETSAGSYDFLTLLHEVGHALGLKHNFSTSPYNSAVLTNALDEVAYTVMSYNDAYSFYPTTPMLLDIAAIQYMYGANYSWNQGDTTYTWGVDERIFETIWDGGGTDTIDASNQLASVRINLNEGAYSNIGKTFIDYLYGNYQFNQGLAIAYGAQIENAIGSNHNDTLTGNALANVLTGGAGIDTLIGGLGNDTYIVNLIQAGSGSAATAALEDSLSEASNAGTDSVQLRGYIAGLAQATTLTLGANLENLDASATGTTRLNLTGNTGDNILTGNAADNRLDGGAGKDTLIGGLGNDIYVVSAVDTIVETSTNPAEIDTVISSAMSWTLGDNLENLTLSGEMAFDARGNSLDNVLIGTARNNSLYGFAGNDRLDGGAGGDNLRGGEGNDIYVVDNVGDSILEWQNEGTDTVHSSISWTLGTELENLLLIGTNAINGTGNALDNQITGNSANNVLNGGAGADTLIGSLGNDTYVVDNVADVVTELAGQGTDTVSSNIAWSLGAELENLILTGAASINGTGNALRNSLTGNNGNNILDGGAGTDTLAGGLGNDTYIVDLIQVGSGSTA
ncbi:M10 family metallopeptidase, partial [Pseudomonas sp. BLCC-B13]|uniref:M10 family metallopeptidase n=1 Tax=Pseudomonas sp. BLCC-B13 TaxID=3025314 RepID=UPI00234EF4DE